MEPQRVQSNLPSSLLDTIWGWNLVKPATAIWQLFLKSQLFIYIFQVSSFLGNKKPNLAIEPPVLLFWIPYEVGIFCLLFNAAIFRCCPTTIRTEKENNQSEPKKTGKIQPSCGLNKSRRKKLIVANQNWPLDRNNSHFLYSRYQIIYFTAL